ncbi:MAG: tetratricopeptide repeat protein [Candidatus Neomarinimicrobiota bacterium]|jgi:tetratricopeptide (TPR) repeat protein|nr:tetratricopeptide repeat protein [Candidatus Neomarinimicrobiota bacterium]MDP7526958.1 tetratricopeptide repeat protein [Candidatus Neomarinimicrobiota bacterium]MEE1506141.1 tetratricopeptide repeat protein [Candidatus Neomarinimicrobiota bacterium]MEE1572439.1 tetratricopeptide repeat protein [Candidatus Neomarinimicrobiota bacterium]
MKKCVKSIFLFIVTGGLICAQSSEILFSKGQEKIKEGAFVQADSLFNKALELDNTYAPAMFQLTQLNLRLGNMEKAQDYIREAVEIDREQYIDTFNKMNEINTSMNDGSRALKGGRFDEAFQLFGTVLEQFPYFSEAAYSMGLAKFREQDFDEAVLYFHKTLELNPLHENAQAAMANVTRNIFNDGNNAYRRGDLEGALAAYYRVLEMDNNFYRAYYQVGVIEAKMRNLSSAIESYLNALKIKPDFFKCWFALGLARSKGGDKEGALDAFNQVIEIDSSYVKAYSSLAEIYIGLKEYTKAFEVLNTATKIDSSYSKSYLLLGIVYTELNQFEDAVDNLEKGVALNPKDAKSWFRLSHAHNELGNCEAAQNAAREATDRKKNFGGGWYELGIAEWCKGDGNKTVALHSLEKARNDRSWRKMAEYEIDKINNPHKYVE